MSLLRDGVGTLESHEEVLGSCCDFSCKNRSTNVTGFDELRLKCEVLRCWVVEIEIRKQSSVHWTQGLCRCEFKLRLWLKRFMHFILLWPWTASCTVLTLCWPPSAVHPLHSLETRVADPVFNLQIQYLFHIWAALNVESCKPSFAFEPNSWMMERSFRSPQFILVFITWYMMVQILPALKCTVITQGLDHFFSPVPSVCLPTSYVPLSQTCPVPWCRLICFLLQHILCW